jgi:hypothetical protein
MKRVQPSNTAICDGCGKKRRVYKKASDGSYGHWLYYCFLCVKEGERHEAKELRRFNPFEPLARKKPR